ncbi:MAG: hypothetical protein P8Z75_07585 [Gammaproteobacteria bacterium]
MKKQPNKPDQQRRGFLQKSIATAAIAVAAPGVAVAGTLDNRADSAKELENNSAKRKTGYHLTPHIAAYYKSCMS